MAAPLGEETVLPLLRGRLGRPYRHVASCPSTQRELPDGAPEGAVVSADLQTEGRGRLGRRWEAPPGRGLLFSLRLLPDVPGERLPELSPLAGQACADAIAGLTGLGTALKHPNDVLVGGRKVAGVLAESSDGRVTLGIGVNVTQERGELPERPVLPATSLLLELGREVDRAELLAAILLELERAYDAWLAAQRV